MQFNRRPLYPPSALPFSAPHHNLPIALNKHLNTPTETMPGVALVQAQCPEVDQTSTSSKAETMIPSQHHRVKKKDVRVLPAEPVHRRPQLIDDAAKVWKNKEEWQRAHTEKIANSAPTRIFTTSSTRTKWIRWFDAARLQSCARVSGARGSHPDRAPATPVGHLDEHDSVVVSSRGGGREALCRLDAFPREQFVALSTREPSGCTRGGGRYVGKTKRKHVFGPARYRKVRRVLWRVSAVASRMTAPCTHTLNRFDLEDKAQQMSSRKESGNRRRVYLSRQRILHSLGSIRESFVRLLRATLPVVLTHRRFRGHRRTA